MIAATVALLDEIRGFLYARSNVAEELLKPVSSLAIHHGLAARNRVISVSESLDLLTALRDVQDLPNGYWLPVRTRIVPLGETALLVSGAPTSFVQNDFGLKVAGDGYGRLVTTSAAFQLPQETLSTWLGAPTSAVDWCDLIIRKAKWGDPHAWEGLEVFNHSEAQSARRWASASAASLTTGVSLARLESQTRPRSYFLLRSRRGSIEQLAELAKAVDVRRFQLALLARAGHHYSFTVEGDGPHYARLATCFLPADEHRLLSAIAPVTLHDTHLTSRLPEGCVSTVRDILLKLGLKER